MSVAFVANVATVTGADTVTVAYPVGANTDGVVVALIDSGHPTSSTVPSTPDGWLLVASFVSATGTYGVDTGPRRMTLFLRVLESGADTPPTFTIPAGTDSRIGAKLMLFSKPAGTVLRWSSAVGQDTSADTAFSVTTAPSLALMAGDALCWGLVVNTDAAVWSAWTVSAAGVTLPSISAFQSQSSVGADGSRLSGAATASPSSGTATGPVTVGGTLSTAATGAAVVVRLRAAVADAGPGFFTATYDDDQARVFLTATGLDGNADTAVLERSTDGVTWWPVRGGNAVQVVGGAFATVADYEPTDAVENTYRVTARNTTSNAVTDVETATVTPVLTDTWLKSPSRPYANATVRVVTVTPSMTRPARAGVAPVVGSTYPVPRTAAGSSRRWTMLVRTETASEADEMALLLGGGEVLFVHPPAVCTPSTPGGYVSIGDVDVEWHPLRPDSRRWTLPCVEVAAPGPDVAVPAFTWATVVGSFADWATLITSRGAWSDVLAAADAGTEILVP